MSFTPLLEHWPGTTAAFGIALAIAIALKYRLPDVVEKVKKQDDRIKVLEKTMAVRVDIDHAIDGFHTVCKFNQVTCQKEMQAATNEIFRDVQKQLAEIYEKLNLLSICNAKVASQVEILLHDRDNHNGNGQRATGRLS